MPELLIEGATVRHEGGSQCAVPDKASLQVRRLFAVLGPTRALARQAADEGRSLHVDTIPIRYSHANDALQWDRLGDKTFYAQCGRRITRQVFIHPMVRFISVVGVLANKLCLTGEPNEDDAARVRMYVSHRVRETTHERVLS